MRPLLENLAAPSHPEHDAIVDYIANKALVDHKTAKDFLHMTGAMNDFMYSRQVQRDGEVQKAPWWKLF